jgi:hypothetical protein
MCCLQVAVKVLEGDAVLRRDAYGLCLEALLGERFKHPNVVATHAFAVVTGKVSGPNMFCVQHVCLLVCLVDCRVCTELSCAIQGTGACSATAQHPGKLQHYLSRMLIF